jgi:hypothetical protein
MNNDIDQVLEIAAKHCSFTLASIAVTRNIDDVERLRAIRRGFSNLLASPLGEEIVTPSGWQQEFTMRHDAMMAMFVIDGRIAEVCAPSISDPEIFASLVNDIGEDADIDNGAGIVMPDLHRTVEATRGFGKSKRSEH